MAYVAVKGGEKAIEASINKLKYEISKHQSTIDTNSLKYHFKSHLDHAMSESSLYDYDIASVAMKQAQGSLEEMVFLLRAYKSSIPRLYYATLCESNDMDIKRRISASFKDIPGGQILGHTTDYTHRLLDFSLLNQTLKDLTDDINLFFEPDLTQSEVELKLPKVSEYLKLQGLLDYQDTFKTPIKDITVETLTFPTNRNERLQILTRGMTQAVIALGYASLRGYGSVHPTVGELRVGMLPIYINPSSVVSDDAYYIGSVEVTEVESFIPIQTNHPDGLKSLTFDVGYGLTFGQNETKTIAMSILDATLNRKDTTFATGDEEFVLYHIDALEATGFISHLKLPHYVTFQSKLHDMRKTKEDKHE
jgi:alpha-D-ribose 1-methylphosphonate 5-triphosphate synthase subunit PhnI